MRNNIKTMLLAGAITASSAVMAYGASTMPLNDGDIDTYSNLEIADISIPSNIDISMQDGLLVDNSSNYSIVNNSKFGIQISDITVTGKNGWTAISYDEPILSKEKNTKELTLEINGDKLSNNGNISLTEGNWLINSMDSKNLDINVKIPSQDSISENSAIASIEYTIETQKNTITYTAGQNGSLTGLSRNIIEYSNGDTIILPDVIPDDGYTLDKWINSLTGETVTEATIVQSDMVLEAQFKQEAAESYLLDKNLFHSVIPDDVTELYFIDEPKGSNPQPVSLDGNILAANDGTVYYVYTTDGAVIEAPEDSSYLFGFTPYIEGIPEIGTPISSMTVLDLYNLRTDNVKNMNNMFDGCIKLKSLDLYEFDTSKVTTMMSMFRGCTRLQSLDLSNFNTSQVTHVGGMFNDCKSLKSLDLSSFDTSQVYYMNSMFNGCESLTSLNLFSFETLNVTNMAGMFEDCASLTSIELSNFDTSKVEYIGTMFSGCESLISLDLSKFNISAVKNMSYMFSSCSANPIYVSSTTYDWFTSNFPENNFVEVPADQHTGGDSGNSN